MRVHRNCCGLDVHKNMIAACLIGEDAEGNSVTEKRLWFLRNHFQSMVTAKVVLTTRQFSNLHL